MKDKRGMHVKNCRAYNVGTKGEIFGKPFKFIDDESAWEYAKKIAQENKGMIAYWNDQIFNPWETA